MTLRLKLLLAQAPLAIALVVVAIVAGMSISSLGTYSNAILKDNYRSVLAAQRMKEMAERLEDLPPRALMGFPAGEIVGAAAGLKDRFVRELEVQESNITEHTEGEATAHLRETWRRYQEALQHALHANDSAASRTYYRETLEPLFGELRAAIDAILAINQDAIVLKSERAQRFAERVGIITISVSVAAILLGGILSTILTTQLLRPLGMLTRAVQHLGEGDFEARVNVSGSDELAQLAETINTMAGRLSQYRQSSLGELLVTQQASQAAIDGLPDPVIVFDINGRILNLNQAAETVLGLATKPLTELPAPMRNLLERVRSHVLSGKGAYVPKGFEEAVATTAPEGERYFLPRATPVYGETGALTCATVVLQDVTRLRRVDELRNDLVATVAHEFRTPLTSLRMAIHMCLEQAAGPLTDRQGDLLYAAREDCERLQAMVDELLDLARIQSGRIELRPRPTAPSTLIDGALDAYRKRAADKHLSLQGAVLPGLSDVLVDRERIHLVLSNLISNAIRHTPSGGTIEVRARAADDRIRFEVADTGSGIPHDQHKLIFERFVGETGDSGGAAGLGLAISKDFVQAHGGEIGVDDTPGGGATLWFTLPTTAALPSQPIA